MTETENPSAVEQAARDASLRYVTDDQPGIRRLPLRTGFRYVGTDGKAVRDRKTLERIRALAIPPAYRDVWVCPHSNGHLQATGRDERGEICRPSAPSIRMRAGA